MFYKRRLKGPDIGILRISPAMRYALSAASYLALQPYGLYRSVGDITKSRRLPASFLAKVLQRLACRGLVSSRRGPGGGHMLARPAGEISLGEIAQAAADRMNRPRQCLLRLRGCGGARPCAIHDKVFRYEQAVWKTLCETKLSGYSRPMKRAAGLLLFSAVLSMPVPSRAALPADFARDCASCHTIGGGRLTGPDLKDVAKRRSPDWLGKFIADPKKMLESGDPTIVELYKNYNNVLMPTISGLTPARISELLGLIAEESKLEKSRFSGSLLINRPLTPGDVADGSALFLGRRALKNGAAACVSCHSVGGMSGLGGGFLGPDLTSAFSRLGGEKGLASWLVSPVSPTMQPVYSARALDPVEILPLTAYLKDAAGRGRPADSIARLAFLIIGILGAAAMFVALDSVWSGRLRSVRRALVDKMTSSEARDG